MAESGRQGTTDNKALNAAFLVIFGITGDLAGRYILPALYHLAKDQLLPADFMIVGVTRRGTTAEEVVARIRKQVQAKGGTCDEAILDWLASVTVIVTMDITKLEEYQRLKAELDRLEEEKGVCMNRVFYLSIPAQTFGQVVGLLGEAKLNAGCQHGERESRLLIEKPFGYDLASAQELVERLAHSFTEDQIYRIDHYLAKETVQNILTFRFSNPLFEAAWDQKSISHLVIAADETIGVEGRGTFYEQTGALRDVVQSHLLQLLALTAMEKPASMNSADIHAEKLKLLQAVEILTPGETEKNAVRGQYKGYRAEVDNPDSVIETFAALKLGIDNERWRGVPILLRTGKALAEKKTEITIVFKDRGGGQAQNSLTIRIQPDEGIILSLQAKKPGFDNQIQPVEMEFCYDRSFDSAVHPDAYERVLADALKGDKTLFATSEDVLAAWGIIEPVLRAWYPAQERGLAVYEPGSVGPSVP